MQPFHLRYSNLLSMRCELGINLTMYAGSPLIMRSVGGVVQ